MSADEMFLRIAEHALRNYFAAVGGRTSAAKARELALDQAELAAVLTVAFHASLRTDEGRKARFQLSLRKGPSTVVPTLSFPAMPLVAESVSRISHAFDPEDMAIAVVVEASGSSIVGIEAVSPWYEPPAPVFRISTSVPGAVRVRFGRHQLASFAAGELEPQVDDFFSATWGDAASLARPALVALRERVGGTSLQRASDEVLERLLRAVTRRGHGGMILLDVDCCDPSSLGRIAYQPHETIDLGETLRHALANYVSYSGEPYTWRIADPRELLPVIWVSDPTKKDAYVDAFERLSANIIRVAHMAGVDGAVLLDGDLRLQGFGARVSVAGPQPRVFRVTSRYASEWPEFDLDRYGTRHLAAVTFAAASPQHIALICSTDGQTAAIAQVGGRVCYWPMHLEPP